MICAVISKSPKMSMSALPRTGCGNYWYTYEDMPFLTNILWNIFRMALYIIDESKLFHRLNANKLLVFFGDVLTITEQRKDVSFPKRRHCKKCYVWQDIYSCTVDPSTRKNSFFSPDLIYLAIRITKVLSNCCVYFVLNKLLSLYIN